MELLLMRHLNRESGGGKAGEADAGVEEGEIDYEEIVFDKGVGAVASFVAE